jgi:gamma-glutamyl:cysteine ligase YbdK (ATP-grasp superfamily)
VADHFAIKPASVHECVTQCHSPSNAGTKPETKLLPMKHASGQRNRVAASESGLVNSPHKRKDKQYRASAEEIEEILTMVEKLAKARPDLVSPHYQARRVRLLHTLQRKKGAASRDKL